jgi:hypothetical protein
MATFGVLKATRMLIQARTRRAAGAGGGGGGGGRGRGENMRRGGKSQGSALNADPWSLLVPCE